MPKHGILDTEHQNAASQIEVSAINRELNADSQITVPAIDREPNAASQISVPAIDRKPERVSYAPLTPRLALQLAAPHTWAASVLPPFIAAGMAFACTGSLSITRAFVLLVICVLMQSAVNTLNDYYDFVKGADTEDDNTEIEDATLVYNNINPKSALALGLGFLVVALVLGMYCIYCSGFICLAIGAVGAFFVVFYSAGKTPISYLPLGELVSGVVMGGLIPLACYQVLTGVFSWWPLLWSLPTIIGIGLIMQMNNTCDIEKDTTSRRKTLPMVLGREKSRKLYHVLLFIWILAIIVFVAVFFTGGWPIVIFMLFASIPLLKALVANPLLPQTRIAGMAQICSVNIVLGAFYGAAIFVSPLLVIVL